MIATGRYVYRSMRHVLLPVGWHQLDVHARSEHLGRYRCDGTIRHQRLLRLPAVVGHLA